LEAKRTKLYLREEDISGKKPADEWELVSVIEVRVPSNQDRGVRRKQGTNTDPHQEGKRRETTFASNLQLVRRGPQMDVSRGA